MSRPCRVLGAALVVFVLAAGKPLSGQDLGASAPAQAPQKPGTRTSAPAKAAAKEPGRPHSLDLSVSFIVLGPSNLGSRDATLTPNQIGAPPYVYFSTSARATTAPGAEVRLGYTITRDIVVEGGMTYTRPGISATVSGDAENVAGFTATMEHLNQFSFDAAVRIQPWAISFQKGRGRPFLAAGIGYLEQLHGGNAAADTGTLYSVGGGVIYLFKVKRVGILPGLAAQGIGIRADVRANLAAGGFSLDARNRWYAAAGGGLFVAF